MSAYYAAQHGVNPDFSVRIMDKSAQCIKVGYADPASVEWCSTMIEDREIAFLLCHLSAR